MDKREWYEQLMINHNFPTSKIEKRLISFDSDHDIRNQIKMARGELHLVSHFDIDDCRFNNFEGSPPIYEIEQPVQKKDEGSHYRKYFRKKVTQADLDRGYVEIQIDPFRIESIFPLSGALFTVLKKILVAGNRQSGKNYKRDVEDCINALERELEIIEEDNDIPKN